ncbi:right-handed parallel beta-helix repeat-containing protein [Nitrospira sp. MA-1]|nr:right-handed parallel beta-helix repeat-containing protein [Nitrospira sp. MA-1]
MKNRIRLNYTFRLFYAMGFFCTFLIPLQIFAAIGAPNALQALQSDRVIHVNNFPPHASDSNPGTNALPLKTIGMATTLALENHKRGFSTKILIYPGVYREKIHMEFSSKKLDPTITFEAIEHGKTIISGSEIWENWEGTKHKNIYTHKWPFKWGVRPYPPGWEGKTILQPIVRRQEMVFVNGIKFNQADLHSEMKPGDFSVSEENSEVAIFLPDNVDIKQSQVEVAVQKGLFTIKGKSNFVLKGLRFQHDASGLVGHALGITNAKNVYLEDCVFAWNNWGGYQFYNVQNLTTRRNVSTHNGGPGHTAWRIKNYLSEDDETSFNNWRGAKGNFVYWAVAGTKIMGIHDATFRRHRAQGNHTAGFWLDYDNKNIEIEDGVSCGNLKHGLFLEATQGPLTITNMKIYQNQEWGIRIVNSSQINVTESQVYHNRGPQIRVQGQKTRGINDWETGERLNLGAEKWTLENNIIVGDGLLVQSSFKNPLGPGLKSNGNFWSSASNTKPFQAAADRLTFSEWQISMNQDQTSTFAFPIQPESGQALLDNCTYRGLD